MNYTGSRLIRLVLNVYYVEFVSLYREDMYIYVYTNPYLFFSYGTAFLFPVCLIQKNLSMGLLNLHYMMADFIYLPWLSNNK